MIFRHILHYFWCVFHVSSYRHKKAVIHHKQVYFLWYNRMFFHFPNEPNGSEKLKITIINRERIYIWFVSLFFFSSPSSNLMTISFESCYYIWRILYFHQNLILLLEINHSFDVCGVKFAKHILLLLQTNKIYAKICFPSDSILSNL